MKKFTFLIPVIMVLLFSLIGTRLFAAGAISPAALVIIMVIFLGGLLLARPKAAAPKPTSDVEKMVRGAFAKDAFSDEPQLTAKFQAALKDYSSNCPKAALGKLSKLAPLCRNDAETYAVSIATAMCHITLQNFKEAARAYNMAIVLHPSGELAITMGSCHQRLGELKKAKDAYEFALELEPENTEARCSLATVYVADGDYETALAQAKLALEQNENLSSALATAAICYGVLDDSLMHKHYTQLAVDNGYSQEKITKTVSALKKRK